VSFAATTLRVASQRVFIDDVYFIIDSVRKLLDIPSYVYTIISLLNLGIVFKAPSPLVKVKLYLCFN